MNLALEEGARQMRSKNSRDGGWQPMSSAPRDGTLVELKCTYGVAPWYCLARWTVDDLAMCGGASGRRVPFRHESPHWIKPEGGGPFDELSLLWRPFEGDPATYVDPTGGLMNDSAYWRGAVAAQHGLALDFFEPLAAANAARNTVTVEQEVVAARSRWQRFVDFFTGK